MVVTLATSSFCLSGYMSLLPSWRCYIIINENSQDNLFQLLVSYDQMFSLSLKFQNYTFGSIPHVGRGWQTVMSVLSIVTPISSTKSTTFLYTFLFCSSTTPENLNYPSYRISLTHQHETHQVSSGFAMILVSKFRIVLLTV